MIGTPWYSVAVRRSRGGQSFPRFLAGDHDRGKHGQDRVSDIATNAGGKKIGCGNEKTFGHHTGTKVKT